MKIRTWDKVQVISGKSADKGKISEVIKTFPDKNKILVKDINIATRHIKKQGTQPGQTYWCFKCNAYLSFYWKTY